MSYKVNNIKVSAGIESTPGGGATLAHVIPISGIPGLDKTAQNERDPALIGNGMPVGKILVSFDVAGSLPITMRACGGVGLVLASLLGSDEAAQVGGGIWIRYIGTAASCKIVANTTADTLTSLIGALGEEVADSNFGTAGTITLTGTSFDTLAELVAAINGYDDYEAGIIFEDTETAVASASIIDGTFQAKNINALFFFSSATSGAYLHKYKPVLEGVERPTLAIQVDGVGDNFLYKGVVIDALSISGALKGMIEADASVMGFDETGSQEASELTLPDSDPMIFANGETVFGGKKYGFVRNITVEPKNNHQGDLGYGQGSLGRIGHSKDMFEATGTLQLRMDSDSFAERGKLFTSSMLGVQLIFKGATLAPGIPGLLILDFPYCGLTEASREDNGGNLDITFNWEAYSPKGANNYSDPATVYLLTTDSAAYIPEE